MQYIYKNVSEIVQHIVGVGSVEAGAEITTSSAIENPNFKYIGEATENSKVSAVTQPQDGVVTEAQKVITEENN